MPAHQINLSDDGATRRVLLALVLEAGGELRVKASTYDGLDRTRLLIFDFDKKKNQVIIRSTSEWGGFASVPPEGHEWSQPVDVAARERARVVASQDAERRSMLSDEQLAEAEEEMARRQQVAKDIADGKSPLRINVKK